MPSLPETTQFQWRLPAGAGLSLDDVDALLSRDGCNAYGISLDSASAESSLRGSVLCLTASRINHECLPNVVRLDAYDEATKQLAANTAISFKALHAIPEGEELTQSYFPLWWDLEERQGRCSELYGFTCTCPRCKVEGAASAGLPVDPGACGGADEGYVDMFLLKYVCPMEECGGTLCPLSPAQPDTAQCNICGRQRTDAEFMAGLEEGEAWDGV